MSKLRNLHALAGIFPIILVALCTFSAHAQPNVLDTTTSTSEEVAENAAPELTIPSLEQQRADLKEQLESAQQTVRPETAQQLGISLEALQGRADRIRALDGLLQQQIGTLQRSAEVNASVEDLGRDIATYQERGLSEPPPYSLGFAEGLQNDVTAEERHLDSLETERASIERERESAKERLAEAQRARRAANEAAAQNSDPANAQRLTWTLNRAKLEERYHQAAADGRKLRLEMVNKELELGQRRLAHLQNKAESVRIHTEFRLEELEARLAEVVSKREALEAALPTLRAAHEARDQERSIARASLEGADASDTLEAELAMRSTRVDTAARALELAEKQLLLHDMEKLLWERRYAVWQGANDEELSLWKEETERFVEETRRDREVQEGRLLDLRASIGEREKVRTEWAGDPAGSAAIDQQIVSLRERESILNTYLSALLPLERFAERLEVEIDRERNQVSWWERWERFQRVAGVVWNYEVFAYEDGAVTVRKMVIAFLVLTIGFLFTGRVCRALRDLLIARTRINENAAAAVEKLFYYLAIILILLYTLNLVNIPLTLFAFFGGAIAIAVGFGAQHLINNFISGFILMLERPIRIGDLVEVDDVHGIIQHVGARSTRVLTSQNIHLLIPNSSLLENTVVNWTLSGEKYCTRVSVGVAYGSPTEKVAALILEASANTKTILDAPKPQVFFTDFGDNALGFEVHVWIKMRRIMDKRRAESELRFEIDRLFREHDICIAFPQRDLHLDTTRPLEIRMVSDDRQEG